MAEDHLPKLKICSLETKEYENATLAELCQKFSGGTISYKVKANVDCILSSLFLINSYLQTLISNAPPNQEKFMEQSNMLESLASHFQALKEHITEKMESSCKNYTAILDASKSEIANGIGVNETLNNTEVADMPSVNQNASTSEEDKQEKLEEIFEKEKKTVGEIKNNVLLLNGFVKEFEDEEKEVELLEGLTESNVTSSVQTNVTKATIANGVNAEAPILGGTEGSNATLPAGPSVANLTESNVVNAEEPNLGVVEESNATLPAGPSVANLTESNVVNAEEPNLESNVVNAEEPNLGVVEESNATLPAGPSVANLTESNVVPVEEPNLGGVEESNTTLSAGSSVANLTESNVVNAEEPNLGVVEESNATLPAGPSVANLTESNVVPVEEPNLGGVEESNATLSAGSSVANLTESNVVNAEEPNLGGVEESNATLSAGSSVANLTESNAKPTELNVVSTLKPLVTNAGDNVENTDNDESMLKILQSKTGLANNTTNESDDTLIDEVKERLETNEEGTPNGDDVEELFEKLF
uniref:Uncharacterized protein n=1 Tax=Octopus bimaculoides TaxID=37653 RepID=A0A0L8I7T9_OCTBM